MLCRSHGSSRLSTSLDNDRFREYRLLQHGLPSATIYKIIDKKHSLHKAKAREPHFKKSVFLKAPGALKMEYCSRHYTKRTARQESGAWSYIQSSQSVVRHLQRENKDHASDQI